MIHSREYQELKKHTLDNIEFLKSRVANEYYAEDEMTLIEELVVKALDAPIFVRGEAGA